MGSVYKTQMLVSGHLLLFSIMKQEASTLEQSLIPIMPLSVAVKSNTALAVFSQCNTSQKFVCSVKT